MRQTLQHKSSSYSIVYTFCICLLLAFVSACSDQTTDGETLAPSEEEQIKAVVENYFRRDPNIPEYIAEVEEVADNWARVSLGIEGVDSDEKVYVYVQDQVNAAEPVPTAELLVSDTSHDVEETGAETDLGWAIITKPQAYFTAEELDAAMVPENIRAE